jgi:hypothetical protein
MFASCFMVGKTCGWDLGSSPICTLSGLLPHPRPPHPGALPYTKQSKGSEVKSLQYKALVSPHAQLEKCNKNGTMPNTLG